MFSRRNMPHGFEQPDLNPSIGNHHGTLQSPLRSFGRFLPLVYLYCHNQRGPPDTASTLSDVPTAGVWMNPFSRLSDSDARIELAHPRILAVRPPNFQYLLQPYRRAPNARSVDSFWSQNMTQKSWYFGHSLCRYAMIRDDISNSSCGGVELETS